jgi:hypothetical protein
MFALFNQHKKLIGYSPDFPNNPNLNVLKKQLPQEFSDLSKWHWEGDYDNGAMVSNKKIVEMDSMQKVYQKILSTYPIGVQLVNIIKQLNILSKKENLYDSSFKEMSSDILEMLKDINK